MALTVVILAVIAGMGDVVGGWLTVLGKKQMSRRTLVYSTAVAAGFMIGVALLDRVRDVYSGEPGAADPSGWVLAGFFLIFILENFFATHAHEHAIEEVLPSAPRPARAPLPETVLSAHGHSHGHSHEDDPLHGHGYLEEAMHEEEHGHALVSQFEPEECLITHTASVTAQWGLLIHTFLDGVAIGAGFAASPHTGWLMFLAVIFHKMPEGFSLASLVLAAGRSKREAFGSSIGLCLATVAGAVTAMYSAHFEESVPRAMLAVATGSFLYIAMCDLLPATNRAKERGAVWVVLLGLLLYWLSSEGLKVLGLH